MQIHATCVARNGAGVLLLGGAGSGKSDLAFRLLDRGFVLVADDRVDIVDGMARAPASIFGLIEVRGVGIVRLVALPCARVRLAVELGRPTRLPKPTRHSGFDVPIIRLDPEGASAAQRVELALDCVIGRITQLAGAFSL